MAQTQSITVEPHGTFTFDVDVYATVWNAHYSVNERQLRAIVADECGYDSVADVSQLLSRFEMIAMLAETETLRNNNYENFVARTYLDNV